MGRDLWGNEEDEFDDRPITKEVNGQYVPVHEEETAPPPISKQEAAQIREHMKVQAPAPTQVAVIEGDPELDLFPDGDPDEEDDFSAVLSDARLRLEQGRLYEMIMNHDLFHGTDADPKDIKNVQREIKKFAKERMEIMLGMRKETTQIERLEIDFPFNQLEVVVLKKLASTYSKGATEGADSYVPEVKKVTEEVENVPRRTGINPISAPKKPSGPAPVAKPKAQPLRSKPAAPVKRVKNEDEEQILAEEGVTKEMIDSQHDPDYVPLDKPFSQLSAKEKADRLAQTQRRLANRRTVKNPQAIPQPTPEQEQMLHSQRVSHDPKSPVNTIMTLLNSQKK